jgi:DNA-binding MarR family transcriptional regulator
MGVATKADEKFQEQLVALVRACGLHRPDTTPCGRPASISEAHAVMEIRRGEPLSQSELARRLRLDKSTVSRLVGLLENRGWINRDRADHDGRVAQLTLTSTGRDAERDLAVARSARFATVVAHIPSKERATVLRSIETLVEAFRAAG